MNPNRIRASHPRPRWRGAHFGLPDGAQRHRPTSRRPAGARESSGFLPNPPSSYDNHKDRHLIGTAKDGKGLVSAMVDKRLDLGLLGPLEMSVDDAMVPLGTPKQR